MSLLRDAVKRNKPKSENSVHSKEEASTVPNQTNFLGKNLYSTTRLGTGGAVNCSGNLGLIDMKTIEDDLQALPKKRKDTPTGRTKIVGVLASMRLKMVILLLLDISRRNFLPYMRAP